MLDFVRPLIICAVLVALLIAALTSHHDRSCTPQECRVPVTNREPSPPWHLRSPTLSALSTKTQQKLADFRRRCLQFDASGMLARVDRETRLQMVEGQPSVVPLALTIDRGIPATRTLGVGATNHVASSVVLISCRVSARLRADPKQFKVDETQWIDRSVFAANDQRWTWYVTPQMSGSGTLTAELRPVMSVRVNDRLVSIDTSASDEVKQYPMHVKVTVPTGKRARGLFHAATALVDDLTHLIEAIIALLAAAVAMVGYMRFRKRRTTT